MSDSLIVSGKEAGEIEQGLTELAVDSIAYVLDKTSSDTESIAIALKGYSTEKRNNINLSVNLTPEDIDDSVALDVFSRTQAEMLAREKGAGYINPPVGTATEAPAE